MIWTLVQAAPVEIFEERGQYSILSSAEATWRSGSAYRRVRLAEGRTLRYGRRAYSGCDVY
jgi:hypothetical protein